MWNHVRIHRAGPREKIYFRPEQVKAAIITCGGLCPGLNDVIRHVSLFLSETNFGVIYVERDSVLKCFLETSCRLLSLLRFMVLRTLLGFLLVIKASLIKIDQCTSHLLGYLLL